MFSAIGEPWNSLCIHNTRCSVSLLQYNNTRYTRRINNVNNVCVCVYIYTRASLTSLAGRTMATRFRTRPCGVYARRRNGVSAVDRWYGALGPERARRVWRRATCLGTANRNWTVYLNIVIIIIIIIMYDGYVSRGNRRKVQHDTLSRLIIYRRNVGNISVYSLFDPENSSKDFDENDFEKANA